MSQQLYTPAILGRVEGIAFDLPHNASFKLPKYFSLVLSYSYVLVWLETKYLLK